MLNQLIETYEKEKKHAPESIHALLDYYQQKYISGAISIDDYKNIYACLHNEGAISAYENAQLANSIC